MASSYAQRVAALQIANQTRIDQAGVKAEIRAGRRAVPEILESPPACLGSLQIWKLLQLAPRVGPKRVRQVLAATYLEGVGEVAPWRKLGDLTPRQREVLAGLMRRDATP